MAKETESAPKRQPPTAGELERQRAMDQMESQHVYSYVGTNHNAMQARMLSNAAPRDHVARFAVERLQQVQRKINEAASGRINLRRQHLADEVREEFHKALGEISEYRRVAASQNKSAAFEAAAKRRNKSSDATKRLADLTENQLRFQALSDHELESRANTILGERSGVKKLAAFRDPTEYFSYVAEMRRRGKSDAADDVARVYADLPVDGLGDFEVMNHWGSFEFHSTKTDPDSIVVRDENGGLVGVQLESFLENGDLSRVPE